jgi:DeoD family purine-nucleoside phosphorylase
VAESVFDAGARLVNDERGMLGYTGTFAGRALSVQTTGMGCPSAGIVFEELAMLGVQRIVRIGTCGGLGAQRGMGDLVVAASASCDDQTPLRYAGMAGYAPAATWSLVTRAVELGRAADLNVHVGPVVTSGLFYDPDPEAFARWNRLGHVGVEMETAMMYTIAAVKGMEALAVMTVSDMLGDDGSSARISDEELNAGVDRMLRVACAVATS